MKKNRFLALLIAMAMLLAAVPVFASAEEPITLQWYYINDEECKFIQEHDVGDVCSRFYNEQGEICAPHVDERTVGIALEDLKAKPQRIMLAGGKHRLPAIRAALKGGFATAFITDQYTAKSLI